MSNPCTARDFRQLIDELDRKIEYASEGMKASEAAGDVRSTEFYASQVPHLTTQRLIASAACAILANLERAIP